MGPSGAWARSVLAERYQRRTKASVRTAGRNAIRIIGTFTLKRARITGNLACADWIVAMLALWLRSAFLPASKPNAPTAWAHASDGCAAECTEYDANSGAGVAGGGGGTYNWSSSNRAGRQENVREAREAKA